MTHIRQTLNVDLQTLRDVMSDLEGHVLVQNDVHLRFNFFYSIRYR